MNILFLTLVKFDDINVQGIYTDLIREFRDNGHNMYVMQPLEKRLGISTNLSETNRINVLNVKIGNITKTNVIEKGISTIMLQDKFIKAFKKYYKNVSFDLVLYSTPPITFSKVIGYIKKQYNAKTYLMLKDIFPQNAVDIGLLNTKNPIYWYFRKKEKLLYKLSDYIGCMSEANVSYVLRNNNSIDIDQIEVCPNSISPMQLNLTEETKSRIKCEYGLPLNKTVFVYGGNLGKPQGIDFVIKCLDKNEENLNSFILIVGSGTEYNKLKNYFDIRKPINSKLIKYIDKDKYELLVNSCDVGLIFLENRFTIPNFPSRLLSYMQASIPVLAATDKNTDIGKIIEKNNFGFWCESNDVNKFNKLLIDMCDEKQRKIMGNKARDYLTDNYTSKHSYQTIIKHFQLREE